MKKLLAATFAITALSAWADDSALITETKMTALAIPPKDMRVNLGNPNEIEFVIVVGGLAEAATGPPGPAPCVHSVIATSIPAVSATLER